MKLFLNIVCVIDLWLAALIAWLILFVDGSTQLQPRSAPADAADVAFAMFLFVALNAAALIVSIRQARRHD